MFSAAMRIALKDIIGDAFLNEGDEAATNRLIRPVVTDRLVTRNSGRRMACTKFCFLDAGDVDRIRRDDFGNLNEFG